MLLLEALLANSRVGWGQCYEESTLHAPFYFLFSLSGTMPPPSVHCVASQSLKWTWSLIRSWRSKCERLKSRSHAATLVWSNSRTMILFHHPARQVPHHFNCNNTIMTFTMFHDDHLITQLLKSLSKKIQKGWNR